MWRPNAGVLPHAAGVHPNRLDDLLTSTQGLDETLAAR
jgi:hypothetical protein